MNNGLVRLAMVEYTESGSTNHSPSTTSTIISYGTFDNRDAVNSYQNNWHSEWYTKWLFNKDDIHHIVSVESDGISFGEGEGNPIVISDPQWVGEVPTSGTYKIIDVDNTDNNGIVTIEEDSGSSTIWKFHNKKEPEAAPSDADMKNSEGQYIGTNLWGYWYPLYNSRNQIGGYGNLTSTPQTYTIYLANDKYLNNEEAIGHEIPVVGQYTHSNSQGKTIEGSIGLQWKTGSRFRIGPFAWYPAWYRVIDSYEIRVKLLRFKDSTRNEYILSDWIDSDAVYSSSSNNSGYIIRDLYPHGYNRGGSTYGSYNTDPSNAAIRYQNFPRGAGADVKDIPETPGYPKQFTAAIDDTMTNHCMNQLKYNVQSIPWKTISST